MIFRVFGADMSIPAIIGKFAGTKADILDTHITGSSVSGLMQDARTVFLYLYSSISSFRRIALPSLSPLAAKALTS